ncbi:unnamed protein product [Heterobilharzia americana]|nr:unnamed protein product [Heterobilharzia americana]
MRCVQLVIGGLVNDVSVGSLQLKVPGMPSRVISRFFYTITLITDLLFVSISALLGLGDRQYTTEVQSISGAVCYGRPTSIPLKKGSKCSCK